MLSLELLIRRADKDASHAPDVTKKKEYNTQQQAEETAAAW